MYRRRNPDHEIQHYKRLAAQGDITAEAKVLQLRIRSGELNSHYVGLAAYLEDEASLLVCPDPELLRREQGLSRLGAIPRRETIELRPSEWSLVCRVFNLGRPLDSKLVVTAAADFAEHVLPIWEAYSSSKRAFLAIQAANDWVEGMIGSEELIDFSFVYGPPGTVITSDAATDAIDAALSAVAAAQAADSGSEATIAFAATSASYAASLAASAAFNAGDSYDSEIPEEDWQRLHLIELLLSYRGGVGSIPV
jgi:hypothetical protein